MTTVYSRRVITGRDPISATDLCFLFDLGDDVNWGCDERSDGLVTMLESFHYSEHAEDWLERRHRPQPEQET
jgi:hypothetical protein